MIAMNHVPWKWDSKVPVGQLLAEVRERLGLSQAALATSLGVSQANLSRIENGTDLRVSTLVDIARSLRLEPMLVPKEHVPAVRALLSELQRADGEDVLERGRFA
jgi:transcriptional regulator with XRE-family HTH domain